MVCRYPYFIMDVQSGALLVNEMPERHSRKSYNSNLKFSIELNAEITLYTQV